MKVMSLTSNEYCLMLIFKINNTAYRYCQYNPYKTTNLSYIANFLILKIYDRYWCWYWCWHFIHCSSVSKCENFENISSHI